MTDNEETTESILQSIVDLGPKGAEIMLKQLAVAWGKAGKEKMAELKVDTTDEQQTITDMFQVSMITEVALALDAAHAALARYNLTAAVLTDLSGECDHPECKVLREARLHPENN